MEHNKAIDLYITNFSGNVHILINVSFGKCRRIVINRKNALTKTLQRACISITNKINMGGESTIVYWHCLLKISAMFSLPNTKLSLIGNLNVLTQNRVIFKGTGLFLDNRIPLRINTLQEFLYRGMLYLTTNFIYRCPQRDIF